MIYRLTSCLFFLAALTVGGAVSAASDATPAKSVLQLMAQKGKKNDYYQIPTSIQWYSANYSVGVEPFPPRFFPQCASYNLPDKKNKKMKVLYMHGGLPSYASEPIRDLYISRDEGQTWLARTQDPIDPPSRAAGGLALLKNKQLLQFGGSDQAGLVTGSNKVYSSTDEGKTWEQVAITQPFPARHSFAYMTLPNSNTIVIVGGFDTDDFSNPISTFNDAWISRDGRGAVWTKQTGGLNPDGSPTFPKRFGLAGAAVSATDREEDSVLVISGGANDYEGPEYYKNDVYFSEDMGVTWQVATKNAPFLPRGYHNMFSVDQAVFLLNGVSNGVAAGYTNDYADDGNFRLYLDLWVSEDFGRTWSHQPPARGLIPRYGACANFVASQYLVTLAGGNGYETTNSVQIAKFPRDK